MDHFNYQGVSLYAEEVAVSEIAEQYGTPLFVYSRATLERHYQVYAQALSKHSHLICFAVKANSNLAVLNVLAKLGAGFDIVSGGELDRVLAAGGDASKVIFSGLGKTTAEIRHALDAGIHCFNVESEAELERINKVAHASGVVAPISVRVNPDVDAGTHPYISTGLKENKFGIPAKAAIEVYKKAASMPAIKITGIDFHIGSQLTSAEPFLDAIDRVLEMIDELGNEGIKIKHIDIGGGLGVTYGEEEPPHPSEFFKLVLPKFEHRDLEILVEPGRSIAANAGIFVTRVEYLKNNDHKNFAIVDGAMNDLIRPALYSAWQEIIPVEKSDVSAETYDVVGPVCESADFLGKERELKISAGDLLAVRSAGAYGFVMSSNYNTRPRAAEVMVDGTKTYVVRERESVAELFANESLLPE
ncbi:MAG: diaminopimelate decarboxylase [Gammaproteobacteria bacterium]|nr:diaminopimelate decarboxylase [Gammaproteobacteria bacterium]MDD9896500.1 diaminopimelate decarboxylase [Gammaproteobacteria bacterium]MDD9958745.1 diaminopimelate decarboxylase [Gammaproteobacteria bacterium]